MDRIKVTVGMGQGQITLEGPRDFVQQEVERLARLAAEPPPATSSTMPNANEKASPMSERDLVAAKKPKNHLETVAVLAFALTESGKTEFSADDLRRAYIRAGVRPPKVVDQAIRDARNLCDFIESGSKRGTYKLSNHGDRTVRFDLPFVEETRPTKRR